MPDIAAVPGFWAVIPAGGAGTRLWPLSRVGDPKFLHDLTGSGRSLLQATVDRLAPLAEDRCLVVTGAAHRDRVVAQLPELDAASVVGEPSPRDSMAAVGLAAAVIELEDPVAVIGSFAADHVVRDQADHTFADAVRRAVAAAREDWLVTVGIEPTGPATGYGYLRQGEPLPGLEGVFAVERFVEKPSAQTAAGYLAAGGYRWNAGIFVVRPTVLLDLLAAHHPQFAADLRGIAAGTQDLAETWPRLPKIALDHAVAEPAADAGRVAVVPARFGWHDIGDFAALGDVLPVPASGPTVLGDPLRVVSVDATGLVVPAGGRTVAVVGLQDVVVVDTGDAVLVTTRARAQDVKDVVEALRAADLTDLT